MMSNGDAQSNSPGSPRSDDVVKLEQHLVLLREEYVKLQQRYKVLEKSYNILNVTTKVDHDSFVCRLLKTIGELFNQQIYSDILIQLDGETLFAHRFVLAARTSKWESTNLPENSNLDLSDIPHDVAFQLVKWVYTDELVEKQNEDFLLALMEIAKRFELKELIEQCELALISTTTVENCLKFYKIAEEIKANVLEAHCSQLISSNWVNFKSEDFSILSGPMTFKLFKTKTRFPLHQAIRMKREDVLFLYLIENDAELEQRVNELDDRGESPLEIALKMKEESIAENLVRHQADLNRVDDQNRTLLHLSIERADEYSASFLIKHECSLDHQTNGRRETPLHLLSSFRPKQVSSKVIDDVCLLTELILQHGADANQKDSQGNTCLHRAILADNISVFKILLTVPDLLLDEKNRDDHLPLWFALQQAEQLGLDFQQETFASLLVERGANINALSTQTSETLLHKCARFHYQSAAQYLIEQGAEINVKNNLGETVLHLSAEFGLESLTQKLLAKGADPNLQTEKSPQEKDEDTLPIGLQTAMHRAVYAAQENLLHIFIDQNDEKKIQADFNIQDQQGQSAFSLILWMNMLDLAQKLISNNRANLRTVDQDQTPLLAQAISRENVPAALFLLEHNIDVNEKTHDRYPIQLAVQFHLPLVVEALCRHQAMMNVVDEKGNSVLWNALDSGQEEIATILVKFGCDSTEWAEGPEKCRQTLLHRAINENNESVACFLIRSGCDINSPRQPGSKGEVSDISKSLETPLHLACEWGLERVVATLIEYHAEINKQNVDGNTPLHVAIINQHISIIRLLIQAPNLDLTVRNRQNQTAFACSIVSKNNEAADLILKREPRAADQLDHKGQNFLHIAVQNADIESVLFLLTVHVNVNNRVQDAVQNTPLHLCVQTGNEIILRSLLLAGTNINDVNAHRKSVLHLASENNRGHICSILLENNISTNLVDSNGNTALHLAVQNGHLDVVRRLLSESDINALTVNEKGMNCLHVLGAHCRENAHVIFSCINEFHPHFPLDIQDNNGNTALLLAYRNGHGQLCRALVNAGANLSICNDESLSIFTLPTASKALLINILDVIVREPPWGESEACLECNIRFTLTNRRHHCRHCGRVLCKRCSMNELAIMKFRLQKPVRVCQLCYGVLTLGTIPSHKSIL